MSSSRTSSSILTLTILLWFLFLSCSILIFFIRPSSLLIIPLFLFLFLIEFLLLLRYVRILAQWRSLIGIWLTYVLARLVAVEFFSLDWKIAATVVLLLVLYALFAGWFTTVALALRRDVSVAYLILFMLAAPVLMLAALRSSGDILKLLQFSGQSAYTTLSPYEISAMAISCMPPLALFTFVFHFIRWGLKEWRRAPL